MARYHGFTEHKPLLYLSHDTEFYSEGYESFNGAYCDASLSFHLQRDSGYPTLTLTFLFHLNTSCFLLPYYLLALVLEGWVSRKGSSQMDQCLGYFDWC
jgi:hypothetical protein